MSVNSEYRFSRLSWPEMNQAIGQEKVVILPTASTEQHGPHLPLDVDTFLCESVCLEVGRRAAERVLVLPPICYGLNLHHIDFPGTIHIEPETFIAFCLDITKSVAYRGFRKILIVNGHGSNAPLVELAARRVIVETDASCTFCNWWQLLQVDPAFQSKWRESVFPGGCAHAGELETSMLLHLAPESVRTDKIKSEIAKTNKMGSDFIWTDLFAKGPMGLVEWTSQYSDTGVMGEAEKATAEKGKRVFEEASGRLAEFLSEYHARKIDSRQRHQTQEPTFPLSFPTD